MSGKLDSEFGGSDRGTWNIAVHVPDTAVTLPHPRTPIGGWDYPLEQDVLVSSQITEHECAYTRPMPASCRVLVVEDEESVRRSLRRLLTSFGHSVSHARTVAEALAKSRPKRP